MSGPVSDGTRETARSSRVFTGLLAAATLAAIGWYTYRALPEGRLTPGFTHFFLTFSAGLALPYGLALALLPRRDGRDGLRLALGSALVNAVWALPLGGLLVLFGGFAMGNRDQIEAIVAVATGALLQLPLFTAALVGLRQITAHERATGRREPRANSTWPLALLLPIAATSASWMYFNAQIEAFRVRSESAMRNDREAQETVRLLQECLSTHRDHGYPATLDACPEAATRMEEGNGYRYEYLPGLPGTERRIRSYLLCAQPLRFRATGYNTVVADAAGMYGAGIAAAATLESPPTCASVLGAERAVVYCAYAYAAREPGRGYPSSLAEIAPCISEGRALSALGADGLENEQGEPYAYLAGPRDENGRVTRFRVYQLRGAGVASPWIDDQGVSSRIQTARLGPAVDGLPDLAEPEHFAPACDQGGAEDCFLAGYEWQRKARQSSSGARDPAVAPLQARALEAFARGCDLGNARACHWLANEVEVGSGTDRNPGRAVALHERACELANADGCSGAAEIYESGRKGRLQTLQPQPASAEAMPDVPRDVPRAVALYQRACDLELGDACFIAARLLASGDGIERDTPRAIALFTQLCDEGFALACARVADIAPVQRSEYLRRACVLGNTEACGS